MPTKCFIKTCRNKRELGSSLHFHRFPQADPFKLNLWLTALQMDASFPPEKLKGKLICQDHFRPEDYRVVKRSGSKLRSPIILLRGSAVPSCNLAKLKQVDKTPPQAEEACLKSPDTKAPFLMECEDDELEECQQAPEGWRDSEDRGEEEGPGRGAVDVSGEAEVPAEVNGLAETSETEPSSPFVIKVIPIPSSLRPNGAARQPPTARLPETLEASQSPRSPLGFSLNGHPVTLVPGGGGAELKLVSRFGGSGGGFTALQMPGNPGDCGPSNIQVINTLVSEKVVFSTPSSFVSTLTPATVSGSSGEEPAVLEEPAIVAAAPPSMVITGVVSGREAEKVIREHSLTFAPEPSGEALPSSPFRVPAPQAPNSSLTQVQSWSSPSPRPGTSRPALSSPGRGAQATVSSPAAQRSPHTALSEPARPPNCPLCRSPFLTISVLRGFMCLCSTQVTESLNYYYKPKGKSRDVSSKRRSSKGPKGKERAPVSLGRPETTPGTVERTSSASPAALELQGKLIILVEDFFYGTDPGPLDGRRKQLTDKAAGSYRCIHCHMMLDNNIRLMAHLKQHAEMINQQEGDLKRAITCQHCYRHFSTPFKLQCHLESVHSQYDSSTKCKICELSFVDEPTFLKHMKVNHKPGEMPYICQVCDFRSSFYSVVVSHFSEAHGNSCNLLCPYCLKVLRSSPAYQQHVTRHLRKNVFSCDMCRLHFLHVSQRSEHRVLHHKTHIRPPQLNGLPSGTKVTVRTYSAVKDSVKDVTTKKVIPGTKVMDLPSRATSEDPPDTFRRKTVESLATLGTKMWRSALLRCVECLFEIPDISAHYPTLVRCSLCRYLTCCSRSYANHMINSHTSSHRPTKYQAMYRENARLQSRLRCVCKYSTTTGDMMANHLSEHPDHKALVISEAKEVAVAPVGKRRGRKRKGYYLKRAKDETRRMSLRSAGGTFVPIHLLPNGASSAAGASSSSSGTAQLSVRRVAAPRPLSSAPAVMVRFLGPQRRSRAKDKEARGRTGPVPCRAPRTTVSPPGPPPPEDPTTEAQLQVVLYALCNGLPQAAHRYCTLPAAIRAWTVHQDHLRAFKGWPWDTDQIAEWVLVRREQQLPISEQNLLQMATAVLGGTSEIGGFYRWAVEFMLRHNLGLQWVGNNRRPLSWKLSKSSRTFTDFLSKQVQSGGLGPSAIGTMDELSIFVDQDEFLAQSHSAFQLHGELKAPLFDIILSGLSDGTFLPPMLSFRGELPAVPEGFPNNVQLVAHPQSLSEQSLLRLWISQVWTPPTRQQGAKKLLILDTYRGHLDIEFLSALSSTHTTPVVVPVGCSCHVQPLDLCVKPVVREFLQARWAQLVSQGNAEGLELGQLALMLGCWLSEVASTLTGMPEILRRSFAMATSLPQDEEEEGNGLTAMIKTLTEALVGPLKAEARQEDLVEVLVMLKEVEEVQEQAEDMAEEVEPVQKTAEEVQEEVENMAEEVQEEL